MWTIVEIGSKQYKVKEGDVLEVERLQNTRSLSLNKILVFCEKNEVKFGTPYVDNIKVTANVLSEEKGEKIVVYKCKRRKKYRVKKGHRQEFTEIVVDSIKIKVSKPKKTSKDKEPLKTKKTGETKVAKNRKETSKTRKTTRSKKVKSES